MKSEHRLLEKDVQSLSRTSVNTAKWSLWRTFCRWVGGREERREKGDGREECGEGRREGEDNSQPWCKNEQNSMSGWWCEACGQACDWSKPNRLLTLQNGDAAQEQVVFLAYGAPDGECGHLICAVELITNLTDGDKLGIVVQELAESRKHRTGKVGKEPRH